jgi:hypothetical protein
VQEVGLEQLVSEMVANRSGDQDRNSPWMNQTAHLPLIQGHQIYWQELQRMNPEEEMYQVAACPLW